MGKQTLNLATKLTIIRILFVPLIIIASLYGWFGATLLLFAIAAATDALDGFIARQFNQQTYLGSLLDPIADKLLLISLFVLYTVNIHLLPYRLSYWLTVTVIFRDLIIVSGCFVIYIFTSDLKPKPLFLSKATTLMQVLTLLIVMGANYISRFVLDGGTFNGTFDAVFRKILFQISVVTFLITIASGVAYLRTGIRILAAYSNHNFNQ